MTMRKKLFSTMEGCVVNNCIYMVDIDTWLFCKYDLQLNQLSIVAELENKVDKLCFCEKILCVNNVFYIVLRNSKRLYVVDEKNTVSCYGRENPIFDNNAFLYVEAAIIDEKIYLLPGNTDGFITVFDTKTKEYCNDIKLDSIVKKTYKSNLILSYVFGNNNDSWFCVNGTNEMYHISLLERKAELIKCSPEFIFKMIGGHGNCLILLEKDGYRIAQYKNKKFSIFNADNIEEKYENLMGYQALICDKENIYLLPPKMDKIHVFRIGGEYYKTISIPEESKNIYEIRNYGAKFINFIINGEAILLLPFSANGIVEIDTKKLNAKYYSVNIPYASIIRRKIDNKASITFYENEHLDVREYVMALID